MLVLGRRVGETICIADAIEIVVVAIDGGQVRIGVRAPREVAVVRGELRREVAAENQRAVAQRSPVVATRSTRARRAG
jgi:carbon storage regulator